MFIQSTTVAQLHVSAVAQHLKPVQPKKKSEWIHAVIATHSTQANKDTSKPMVELTDSIVNTDLNKELTGSDRFLLIL